MEWCCLFYNDIKYLIGGLEKLTYQDKLEEGDKILLVSLIATMLKTADENLEVHFNKALVSSLTGHFDFKNCLTGQTLL